MYGDATKPESITGAMDGCDAVIHLVGIIEEDAKRGITYESLHVEATRSIVAEARRAGIQRFVHMSANGADPEGVSRYQTTKWEAEELVRAAEFDHWMIIRPGMVFGNPPPGTAEFCTILTREVIRPLPVIPVFGKGDYMLQPVSVEEVASAMVQALELDSVNGKTIVAVGPEAMSYKKVLDMITEGAGLRPRLKLGTPVKLMRPLIGKLYPIGALPISPDQFSMLIQGNVGDPAPFYDHFELIPHHFTSENLAYLRRRL